MASLSVADRARARQQRKERVARSRTRQKHSREARRRHGFRNPSDLTYTADLRKIARETWDLLVADLAPRLDAADDVPRTPSIRGVRFELYDVVRKKAIPAAEAQAKRVGRIVDEDGKRVLGVDPRLLPSVGPQLDSFVIENVRLITKMAEEQHQAIFQVVKANFGLRHEELSKKLEDAFGVSQSRADLIARDQTLKLAGDLTHIRQTQAGITSYVWTTSGDERVREEHALLDGETFEWSSPPAVGHPGQDYCCRCTSYPVVPGFEDEG